MKTTLIQPPCLSTTFKDLCIGQTFYLNDGSLQRMIDSDELRIKISDVEWMCVTDKNSGVYSLGGANMRVYPVKIVSMEVRANLT